MSVPRLQQQQNWHPSNSMVWQSGQGAMRLPAQLQQYYGQQFYSATPYQQPYYHNTVSNCLVCSGCSESCSNKEELKLHICLYHLDSWAPYRCALGNCAERRSTEALMRQHIKSDHRDCSKLLMVKEGDSEMEGKFNEMYLESLKMRPAMHTQTHCSCAPAPHQQHLRGQTYPTLPTPLQQMDPLSLNARLIQDEIAVEDVSKEPSSMSGQEEFPKAADKNRKTAETGQQVEAEATDAEENARNIEVLALNNQNQLPLLNFCIDMKKCRNLKRGRATKSAERKTIPNSTQNVNCALCHAPTGCGARHVWRHLDEKRYYCQICKFSSNSKSAVLGHMVDVHRVHVGEEDWLTDRTEALNPLHAELLQSVEKSANNSSKGTTCQKCGYSGSTNAKEHALMKHANFKAYKCPVKKCDFGDNYRPGPVKDHMKNKHPNLAAKQANLVDLRGEHADEISALLEECYGSLYRVRPYHRGSKSPKPEENISKSAKKAAEIIPKSTPKGSGETFSAKISAKLFKAVKENVKSTENPAKNASPFTPTLQSTPKIYVKTNGKNLPKSNLKLSNKTDAKGKLNLDATFETEKIAENDSGFLTECNLCKSGDFNGRKSASPNCFSSEKARLAHVVQAHFSKSLFLCSVCLEFDSKSKSLLLGHLKKCCQRNRSKSGRVIDLMPKYEKVMQKRLAQCFGRKIQNEQKEADESSGKGAVAKSDCRGDLTSENLEKIKGRNSKIQSVSTSKGRRRFKRKTLRHKKKNCTAAKIPTKAVQVQHNGSENSSKLSPPKPNSSNADVEDVLELLVGVVSHVDALLHEVMD